MALCPYCQNDIGDDFGLTECSNCRKVVFLEMDGRVVSLDEDQQTPEPEPFVEQAPEQDYQFDEPLAEQPFVEALPSEPVYEETLFEEPPVEEPQESLLESFQDSPVQRDGNLRYTLTISGIDSSELRQEVVSVLSDRKFLFDVPELLQSVKQGQLRIQDISAVKASMIVFFLKSTPLEISWEQHA